DGPVSPFTVRESTRRTPTSKTPSRAWSSSHPRPLPGEHGGTAGTHDVQRVLEAPLEPPPRLNGPAPCPARRRRHTGKIGPGLEVDPEVVALRCRPLWVHAEGRRLRSVPTVVVEHDRQRGRTVTLSHPERRRRHPEQVRAVTD